MELRLEMQGETRIRHGVVGVLWLGVAGAILNLRLTCGVRSMLLEICDWFTLFAAVIFVVRQGLIQRHRFTARVFTSFQLCRTNGDFVRSSLHMFGRRTSLNVGRAQTQLVSLALPLPFTVVIP